MTGAPEAGLCEDCVHARRVRSARGSSFWRCARSERDPAFAKYPPLPVRVCPGHAPADRREQPEDRRELEKP